MEDKLQSAAELPYFEGDFWPNVLEENIKELDQEEEEKRRQAEAAEAASAAANNVRMKTFLVWWSFWSALFPSCWRYTLNLMRTCAKLSKLSGIVNKSQYYEVSFTLQVYNIDGEGETEVDGKKKSNKKVKKTNKSKSSQRKSSTKSKFNTPQLGNDLSTKIYATMEKHKEVFFVIRLHSAQSAASLAVSLVN